MATVPLRTLLLLVATTGAIGCEAYQRSAQSGGGDMPTGPSALKRVVDDVPGEGSGGSETTTTGCDTPPCTPGPEPRPSTVRGQFLVSSADRSTIEDSYETRTAPSGLPENGIIGNSAITSASWDTFVHGTGRFAGVRTAIYSVDFGPGGSTANISLKWSIAQQGIADGYRSYGDSATLPYSRQKVSDPSCASGYRAKIEISGRMENIGPITATLNHCVSVIQ